jgi:parallel beta-helix repeat protein
MGGKNSTDTIVINNQISGGCEEGIYIGNGENPWIIRNLVEHNNKGIVCVHSAPLIQSNHIR